MNDNENTSRKSTVNLLAVLFAFMIGLTVGNVDPDSFTGLRAVFSGITEHSQTSHSLKSRDSTTTKTNSAETDTTDSIFSGEAFDENQKEKSGLATDGDFFTIYKTPTGKKYHFNPSCAGDNRIVTNLDEATKLGLTPCKKCADG